MKKPYSVLLTRFIWILILALYVSNGYTQDFPVPDIAITFDDTTTSWQSKVTDISGNDNNGYWYNYWDGAETMYAKYDAAEGKFGGAWYTSGYHACCEEMASSSMDFILLCGNQNPKKDVEGFNEFDSLFHSGFTGMSFAFWHKSTRVYEGTQTPCPPNPLEMHEQELLVSIGNRNGIEVNNFKGYYEVRIGQKAPESNAAKVGLPYLWNGSNAESGVWHHIAVTYDGADNGKLTVYIDGELGLPYLGDPNPVESGYTELYPDGSSSEIGAQNAGGLFGDPGDGYWASSAIDKYCVTVEDTSKYRTGWPANGYFDDFVFYKNSVLSISEVKQLMNSGISTLLGNGGTGINHDHVNPYSLYPNPGSDFIIINSRLPGDVHLKIYNIIGALEMDRHIQTNTQIDLSRLAKGVYIVQYNEIYTEKLIVR